MHPPRLARWGAERQWQGRATRRLRGERERRASARVTVRRGPRGEEASRPRASIPSMLGGIVATIDMP